MTALDQQIGVKDESTFGTAVTVDRFFEFESESIAESWGRTAGDPLRPGTFFPRSDRFAPYFVGASGEVAMAVMSKGHGWWLKHLLGASSSTAEATDSVYTHTGTPATLKGDSFTLQVTRPFNPSGTAQAFTYAGCKVPAWGLANTVDGDLILTVTVDAAKRSTATSAASASYPTGMEPLTWAGGTITVAGSTVPMTEFALNVDNGLNLDRRRFIQSDTAKKEPTGDGKTGTFSFTADFDSLDQVNRVASSTASGAVATIVGTWTAPTLAGTSAYPQLIVTIDAARFDEWQAANGARGEGIMQQISGSVAFDGTDDPIKIEYKSTDATA